MKKLKIKSEHKIYFKNENKHYNIKAFDNRFAICTRKFNKKEDYSILKHAVEMQAYMSKKEAYQNFKNEVVYTIVDFKKNVRSTDYWTFGKFDYKLQSDIEQCLVELSSGDTKLSERNKIELQIESIDEKITMR